MRNRHKVGLLFGWLLVSALSFAQSGDSATSAIVAPEVRETTVLTASLYPAMPLAASLSDSELPDAPSAQQGATLQSDATASPVERSKNSWRGGAPPAAVGGPFGMESQIADKKYIAVTAAMFGATVANIELTQRCQEVKECSYVPSSLRSRFAMYGIAMPAEVGVAYLTYHMKKRHNSLWFMPSALMTAANLYIGIHAYHRSQE